MTAPGKRRPWLVSSKSVDLAELADTLGFVLRVALVRVFERFFDRFGDEGLRSGEFSALLLIGTKPGLRHGGLARPLWTRPAHMTRMIRRLKHQGLLVRDIPEDESRSVTLDLAAAGSAFVADQRARHSGANDDQRHNLTPTEEREIARLLRKSTGLDR